MENHGGREFRRDLCTWCCLTRDANSAGGRQSAEVVFDDCQAQAKGVLSSYGVLCQRPRTLSIEQV